MTDRREFLRHSAAASAGALIGTGASFASIRKLLAKTTGVTPLEEWASGAMNMQQLQTQSRKFMQGASGVMNQWLAPEKATKDKLQLAHDATSTLHEFLLLKKLYPIVDSTVELKRKSARMPSDAEISGMRDRMVACDVTLMTTYYLKKHFEKVDYKGTESPSLEKVITSAISGLERAIKGFKRKKTSGASSAFPSAETYIDENDPCGCDGYYEAADDGLMIAGILAFLPWFASAMGISSGLVYGVGWLCLNETPACAPIGG
jgi:hypothetical protein